MNKLDGRTLDIEAENIKKLKELFPEIDTDGKIDFEKLKQVLGDYVDDSDERYRTVWNGKGEALRLSQTPSMGTLRPDKEDSKDWDNTENLYIEGDNLEVLKLLQKSYFNKVKMIYIDPPYNTGKDFVYPDNFKDNIKNYKKITGQVDSEGKTTTTNQEHSGRYHTDWLNMMYPRLRLARNLMTDDGVIFISIDDNEVDNLRKICDEIFGEDNFVSTFNWKRKKEISSDSKNVSIQGEYLLCYSKTISMQLSMEDLSVEYVNKSYSNPTDQFPDGMWRPVPITVSKGLSGGGYNYTIVTPKGIEHTRLWAYPQKSYMKLLEKNKVYFGKNEEGIPQRIIYAHESKGQPVTNYWDSVATNKEGKKEILKLFGDNYFDTPKPVELLLKILNVSTDGEAIILDFFAGSSTTAHAIMELNAQDKGNRKHIMVQLPEIIDGKMIAHKAGYENIAEIGKERIRRAGEQIKSDLQEKYEKASEEERKTMKNPSELDIGFKVFKLDSSNIKEWNPGKYDDLQMALEDSLNPYVEGRTEEDVVYEMILKMGLDLTYPVRKHEVDGKTIYSIGYGLLMICLSEDIDLSVAKKMVQIKNENNLDEFRTIFRDSGFNSDRDKTNVKETLKSAGLAEESFITL